MKTIIVTPLYYIGKEFVDVINKTEGDITVLITDDVSPIFPLDTRTEWLERTIDRKIEVHSVIYSDESKEFKEAITLAIKAIDKEAKVIYFFTKDAHKNLKRLGNRHFLRSPLDPEVIDQLDAVFKARFGDDFRTFTQPKNKVIPQTETINLIPCFTHNDKKYYGFIYDFKVKNVAPLTVQLPYKASVRETDAYIKVYTERYFGPTTGDKRLIGWINENYWVVDIAEPSYFDEENGTRKFFAIDADVVFFDTDFMKKVDNPLLHWIKNRAEEVEQVLPDDVKI